MNQRLSYMLCLIFCSLWFLSSESRGDSVEVTITTTEGSSKGKPQGTVTLTKSNQVPAVYDGVYRPSGQGERVISIPAKDYEKLSADIPVNSYWWVLRRVTAQGKRFASARIGHVEGYAVRIDVEPMRLEPLFSFSQTSVSKVLNGVGDRTSWPRREVGSLSFPADAVKPLVDDHFSHFLVLGRKRDFYPAVILGTQEVLYGESILYYTDPQTAERIRAGQWHNTANRIYATVPSDFAPCEQAYWAQLTSRFSSSVYADLYLPASTLRKIDQNAMDQGEASQNLQIAFESSETGLAVKERYGLGETANNTIFLTKADLFNQGSADGCAGDVSDEAE